MIHIALNSATDGHRIWQNNAHAPQTPDRNHASISNEKKYSCNDEINMFVVETKNTNQSISRARLAQYPTEYQIAIFNSLSNVNKARIFTEKIHLLLETENLNVAEKDHVRKALHFLNPELYNYGYEDMVLSFFRKWEEHAIRTFKWDSERSGIYFKTILSPLELKQLRVRYHDSSPHPNRPVSSGKPACECSTDSGNDFCFRDNQMCQISNTCEGSSWGCGWFGLFSCGGSCEEVL